MAQARGPHLCGKQPLTVPREVSVFRLIQSPDMMYSNKCNYLPIDITFSGVRLDGTGKRSSSLRETALGCSQRG